MRLDSNSASGDRLSLRICLGYAVGSLGMSIFATVAGLLLLDFLTGFLAVPPLWAAFTVFIPKIWDITIDPIVGHLSDRTQTSWGRRRPYLLAGAILLGVTFFLLFSVPKLESPAARALYVMVMFIAASTGYTVFGIPYLALPAEMTFDYHERTRLVSFRIVFLLTGILFAGALAPLIIEEVARSNTDTPTADDFRRGYMVMGTALGIVSSISMLWTFFALRNAPQRDAILSTATIREQLLVALKNRPFFRLLIPYFIQLLAVNCTVASMPFFVQYILGDRQIFVGAFLCLIIPSIVAMPLWVLFSGRYGKLAAYLVSVSLFTLGLLSLFWASPERIEWFYFQMGVVGVAYAGTQAFPFAMLPDVIQYDEHLTGLRREGAYTGVWLAGENAGVAFGTFLAGAVLAICGFVESTTGVTAQTPTAILGVKLAFTVVPAILLAVSVPLLARYDLTEEKMKSLQKSSELPSEIAGSLEN